MLFAAALPAAARPGALLQRPSPLLQLAPRRCLGGLCSRRQQQQHRQQTLAAAEPRRAVSEADLYVAEPVPAVPPPAPAATKVPFYIYGPLAFLAFLGVMRTIGALMRRGRAGSLSDDYRRDIADDQHYERMMRGMKTTQYEELSEEQILAARQRRMREIARDSAPMDLDQIELPENHPFAVKKRLSPEEEALQTQRLRARRGLSQEDLRLLEQARRQSLAEE